MNRQLGCYLTYVPILITIVVCLVYWRKKVHFCVIAYYITRYFFSEGYGRAYRERLLRKWGIVDVNDCCSCAKYLVDLFWHRFSFKIWKLCSILNNMFKTLHVILICVGRFRSSWCRTIVHRWGICWGIHYPSCSCFQRYIQGRSFLVWCKWPIIWLFLKYDYNNLYQSRWNPYQICIWYGFI